MIQEITIANENRLSQYRCKRWATARPDFKPGRTGNYFRNKKFHQLIFLFFLLSCTARESENQVTPLTVADFDFNQPLGSQGAQIQEIDTNHFEISLGSAPQHPDWANMVQFMINGNAKGNKLVLDVKFDHPNPHYLFNDYFYSWSYDLDNWHPIHWENGPQVSGNQDQLIFPEFTRDTVYLGHQVPFSLPRLEQKIEQWRQNEMVEIITIGKSLGGNDLYRIVLTNYSNEKPTKPWVHYFANQHPGEHNAHWRMVGMIDYLLGAGKSYLDHSINHFIMMSSPDAPHNGWYRVNAEGRDMNREYVVSGADSTLQGHEGYLLQKDFEQLMALAHPPVTAWAMHTWQGPVETWMIPGPEIGSETADWEELKELMQDNDPEGLLEELQNRASETDGSWGNGPHHQFGITTFLCEGGGNIYTREDNFKSGEIIMKSISSFYKGQ